MEFSQAAGYLSGIVFAISSGWYTYDVYKKRVTASLVTFIMFSLINASQLVALIDEKVWGSVPFTFVGLVASILISFFSLRNHKFYFDTLDKISLAGAILGYVAWQATSDAALNIYILSLTTMITFTPLIVKTFKRPDTETKKPWVLNLVASFLLVLTVNSFAPVAWVIPVRQFLCSVLMNIALFRNRD